MNKPSLPLVLVTWVDAFVSASGWERVSDEGYSPQICFSSGFMKEFPDYLVIWGSGASAEEGLTEEYNARIWIPRTWVMSIQHLDWEPPNG